MLVSTRRYGVYHLLPTCPVYMEVGIKFSASEYFSASGRGISSFVVITRIITNGTVYLTLLLQRNKLLRFTNPATFSA